MPPEGTTGNLDIFKTDELFRAGKVASNLEWIGFAESSIHPETSKVADKIDFSQLPGLKTDKGIERWSVIGGQPFVLMTWNTDVQNKEALDFVKWWLSKDTQIAYAKAGGQSALKSVYTDPSYVSFRPWNRTWAESLDWQKDFWHIPEFFELLTRAAGGVHEGGDRSAGRQDHARQHRQLSGEDSERGGAHQISATIEGTSSAPPEGGAHPDVIDVLRPAVPHLNLLQAHLSADA